MMRHVSLLVATMALTTAAQAPEDAAVAAAFIEDDACRVSGSCAVELLQLKGMPAAGGAAPGDARQAAVAGPVTLDQTDAPNQAVAGAAPQEGEVEDLEVDAAGRRCVSWGRGGCIRWGFVGGRRTCVGGYKRVCVRWR
uniref:Uncharacterized protein n=1 Tax=Pyrodinium bahamense TaxID=73915 RepID=A0A7S0AWN6_9DINO|mmetsp:Transcript_42435/g.118147  ORF Transcript_42435/g.118147 Transcript_42435/m.118147 type:complete len:139 (+) Transcript_42435:81-497(+)